MDPKYILIEDFMSHRRTEIDCTKFQSTLILGKNKADPRESNGIGKSVIFHAIKYALFGVTPTSIMEKIIREGTKEAKVTFDFEIDGRTWRIVRARTKTKSKVELKEKIGGEWTGNNEQKTPSETHEEILKILSINYGAFEHSVLFSQNDLYGLASAKSPDERKKILKNALGLADYKRLEEMVRKEMTKLSKKIAGRKAVAESLGDPQKDIDNKTEELETINASIKELEKVQEETKLSLKTKRSEFSNLQRLVSSELVTSHDKLSTILSENKKIKSTISTLKVQIEENQNKITSLQNKVSELQIDLSKLQEKKTNLFNKPTKQLSKLMEDLEKAQERELNGKSLVGSLRAKAEELRQPIPDGEECPTCHQSLTADYKDNYRQVALANVRKAEEEIAFYNKKLKAVAQKKNRLGKQIEEINTITKEISQLDGTITNKQIEINHNQDYINRLSKADQEKKRELSSLEKSLKENKELEKSLRSAIESSSKDDISGKISKVKKEVDQLEDKIDQISKDISESNKQSGTTFANIDSRKKDLEKLKIEKEKIKQLDQEYDLHRKVREAFSSGGIPTLIIQTILDDLQTESNNYLSMLKPGLELQFDENLNLDFFIDGKNREYQQLSGGQKMDFAFALKLGLSIIIQRRLGIDIKLLLLDEVDQSLDIATTERYAEIIKKLQKDFTVFVITHNERLKDKFNNAIVVEGDLINGVSSSLISW